MKMKFNRYWWKYLIVGLLIIATLGGIVYALVSLSDAGKFDSKDISSLSFTVGGLDSKGRYMNTNASIYTKDVFECKGLEATPDFDNNIEYQIYFYDQNNEFVHTTGRMRGAFVKDSVPFFAKYARIVITPTDDDVVSKTEVLKYAKQLNVSVNREQGFKNYTENLVNIVITGKLLEGATGNVVESDKAGAGISDYINITPYKESMIFREKATDITGTVLFCYSADKSYIGHVKVGEVATIVFTSSEGINYYSIPTSAIVPADAESATTFIRITGSVFPEIYCR